MNVCSSGKGFGVNYQIESFKSPLTDHGTPLYGAVEKPKSFIINYTLFNLIIITNFIISSKVFSRIRFK